jgi:DNA-binding transcriptional ArsR family regulator
VWPRLRSLLDADLHYRAAQLTSGGMVRVLAHLHPQLEYADDALRICWGPWNSTSDPRGTGLLLVPCVFAWPALVLTKDADEPMLTYAPRGIGRVWAGTSGGAPAHLARLLGRSRAALLARLDLPVSTTQLAAHLGLTAAAVSEHLSVLRGAGLVTSRRSGRLVLYQRTPPATRLLDRADLDRAD